MDWLDDHTMPIKQKRTKENNKDKEYMDNINNQTETEFKQDLIAGMEREIQYPSCNCEFCQRDFKKFIETPELFLEERWQDHVEDMNREPCSEEELDAIFAEQGIVLDRKTGRVNLISK